MKIFMIFYCGLSAIGFFLNGDKLPVFAMIMFALIFLIMNDE